MLTGVYFDETGWLLHLELHQPSRYSFVTARARKDTPDRFHEVELSRTHLDSWIWR